jgi:hypothetical protein
LIHQPPRRLPLVRQAVVGKVLEDMKWHRMIKEINSPWSFPVLVWKKNGDFHFCMAYRKLMSLRKTVSCYQGLMISWTHLLEPNGFPPLDLKNNYWQMAVHLTVKKRQCSQQTKGFGDP